MIQAWSPLQCPCIIPELDNHSINALFERDQIDEEPRSKSLTQQILRLSNIPFLTSTLDFYRSYVALPESCRRIYNWTIPVPLDTDTFPRDSKDYTGLGFLPERMKSKQRKLYRQYMRSYYDSKPVIFIPGGVLQPSIVPKPDIQPVQDVREFPAFDDDEKIMAYVVSLIDTQPQEDLVEEEISYRVCYLWQKDYRPSPILPIGVENNFGKHALIDTGASVSIISYSWFHELSKRWSDKEKEFRRCPTTPRIFGISGAELKVLGNYHMIVRIGRGLYPHNLVVVQAPDEELNPTSHKIDAILGVDFLRKHRVFLGFGQPTRKGKEDAIYIGGQRFRALPDYVPLRSGRIGLLNSITTEATKESGPEEHVWIHASISQDVTIPPQHMGWIPVQCQDDDVENYDPNEPAPTMVAPGLMAYGLAKGDDHNRVLLHNTNKHAVELDQTDHITLIQSTLVVGSEETIASVTTDADPSTVKTRDQLWEEMLKTVVEQADLSEPDRQRLASIIREYKDHFGLKGEPPGKVENFDINVELKTDVPIHVPQYRLPDSVQEDVHQDTLKMVDAGIVKPSTSGYNFAVWPVPKKIPTKEGGVIIELRPCLDLRPLNKETVIVFFYVPTVDGTLGKLALSICFTGLDILSGFWHLPLRPDQCKYFAFSTHRGHFEYNRLVFGWINSPFFFQQFAQTRIANPHEGYVETYMDDVMIHSPDKEKHFSHLIDVLNTIRRENIILKLSKCSFFQPEMEYLGHIISKNGIRKDPKKIAAIKTTLRPKSKKEVRRFLGKINYYGKFVPNMSRVAKPLSKLTSQSDTVEFCWGPEQEAAFLQLLHLIEQDLVLALPDPQKLFTITTDASEYGIGAVLSQRDEASGIQRPIMFISTTFDDTQRRYTVTEKELFAIVYALKKFKPYIYGRKFEIVTDHRALVWLCGKRDPPSRLGRWSQQISEYAQDIRFVSGKQNKVADALSRSPFVKEEDAPTTQHFGSNPCLSEEIKRKIARATGIDFDLIKENEAQAWAETHYKLAKEEMKRVKDEVPWKLPETEEEEVAGLEETPAMIASLHYGQMELENREVVPTLTPELWSKETPDHGIPEGVKRNPITRQMRYVQSGLLWVPPAFRDQVCKAYHLLPHNAHLSAAKMVPLMMEDVRWKGMIKEVQEWVQKCPRCQRTTRGAPEKPAFQARRYPQYPMQRISLDFLSIKNASPRGDFRVLIIVDDFTRYAEAIVTSDETGKTAADALMTHIICRYGLPEEIVSDQGSAFISDLFERLVYQLGTDKIFTTAYHPAGNGVNERMHGTLYNILRSLTATDATQWRKQLPLALYLYRTTYHKAIGMSPHKALYGYQPRHIALEHLPVDDYFPLDERLKALIEIHQRCKQFLQKQQDKRNMDRNIKRGLREFGPGDLVKLRIQQRAHKLSPFWKGPFQVIRKVNPVNYEVRMPDDWKASSIIHVQHMKPWKGSYTDDQLPEPEDKNEEEQDQDKDEVETDEPEGKPSRPVTRAYKKLMEQVQARDMLTKEVYNAVYCSSDSPSLPKFQSIPVQYPLSERGSLLIADED